MASWVYTRQHGLTFTSLLGSSPLFHCRNIKSTYSKEKKIYKEIAAYISIPPEREEINLIMTWLLVDKIENLLLGLGLTLTQMIHENKTKEYNKYVN